MCDSLAKHSQNDADQRVCEQGWEEGGCPAGSEDVV